MRLKLWDRVARSDSGGVCPDRTDAASAAVRRRATGSSSCAERRASSSAARTSWALSVRFSSSCTQNGALRSVSIYLAGKWSWQGILLKEWGKVVTQEVRVMCEHAPSMQRSKAEPIRCKAGAMTSLASLDPGVQSSPLALRTSHRQPNFGSGLAVGILFLRRSFGRDPGQFASVNPDHRVPHASPLQTHHSATDSTKQDATVSGIKSVAYKINEKNIYIENFLKRSKEKHFEMEKLFCKLFRLPRVYLREPTSPDERAVDEGPGSPEHHWWQQVRAQQHAPVVGPVRQDDREHELLAPARE